MQSAKQYHEAYEKYQRLLFKLSRQFFIANKERCLAAGVEFDDLCQVAYLGLVKAVDYYDKEKGYKLPTYFEYNLKNAFNELIGARGSVLPLNNCISLDKPISEDDTSCVLGDIIPDKEAHRDIENIAERDFNAHLRHDIKVALSELSAEENAVIMRYFWKNQNTVQIANILGIPLTQVRKLYESALRKLRNHKALRKYGYL